MVCLFAECAEVWPLQDPGPEFPSLSQTSLSRHCHAIFAQIWANSQYCRRHCYTAIKQSSHPTVDWSSHQEEDLWQTVLRRLGLGRHTRTRCNPKSIDVNCALLPPTWSFSVNLPCESSSESNRLEDTGNPSNEHPPHSTPSLAHPGWYQVTAKRIFWVINLWVSARDQDWPQTVWFFRD